jgi:nucleotide-binding universal stress UspA family protein
MADPAAEPATGRILVAAEAGRESRAVITAAARLARWSHSEVLVLSVRERDFARGFAWDIYDPGEIAATVSDAIYELQRVGVEAHGLIRTARSGRVAEEILYAAHQHHAEEIVVGAPRRSWLRRLLSDSVTTRVVRLSDLPVLIVPGRDRSDSPDPVPSGSPRGARGRARA